MCLFCMVTMRLTLVNEYKSELWLAGGKLLNKCYLVLFLLILLELKIVASLRTEGGEASISVHPLSLPKGRVHGLRVTGTGRL